MNYLVVCRPCLAHLQNLGLQVVNVPGDGHCLFHSFEQFMKKRSFSEWRNALASSIQDRKFLELLSGVRMHCDNCVFCRVSADTEHVEWKIWYLSRANESLFYLGRSYSKFEALMDAMRRDEWGYSDFISEFCLHNEVNQLDAVNVWNTD